MAFSGRLGKSRLLGKESEAAPVRRGSASLRQQTDGEIAPGTMIGEYRVESKLGQGGMASVYAATQPVIGKRAAIKVMSRQLCLDPTCVERFLQEARAVNQIRHPNIVDVFAFGTLPDGRSYFVMEWLPGETLASRLRRGRLSLPEAIAILFQISDGLGAAHEQGIVHRDLKPDNVFLVPVRANRLLVKLLDFGIAKLLGTGHETRVDRTADGSSVGTPSYMSPEQARGVEVDHKSDIYSLGVTAFEMLLGRLPFLSPEALDMMWHHVHTLPPPPSSIDSEIPLQLERLLLLMLDKQPERRPPLHVIESRLSEVRDNIGLASPGSDPGPNALRALETGASGAHRPFGGSGSMRPLERTQLLSSLRGRTRKVLGWLLGLAGIAAAAAAVTVMVPRHQRATTFLQLRHAAHLPEALPPAAPPPVVVTPLPPDPTPAPATLVVQVDVSDASIELDGKLLAAGSAGGRFEASPGAHELLVTAPHRRPFHQHLGLSAGVIVEVPVTLERVPPPSRPRPVAHKPPAAKSAPAPLSKLKRGDHDYMVDPFASPAK